MGYATRTGTGDSLTVPRRFLLKAESKGSIRQITNFTSGKEKEDKELSSQESWLEEQQLELFEVLRDRKERKDLNKEHNEELKIQDPRKIYIGDKNISNLTLVENDNYVTYKLSKYPSNKRTMVPHFVSESGHTEEQKAYSKVGGKQASHELWVLDIERDTTIKIDYSALVGVFKKPLFLAKFHIAPCPPGFKFSLRGAKHDQ